MCACRLHSSAFVYKIGKFTENVWAVTVKFLIAQNFVQSPDDRRTQPAILPRVGRSPAIMAAFLAAMRVHVLSLPNRDSLGACSQDERCAGIVHLRNNDAPAVVHMQ